MTRTTNTIKLLMRLLLLSKFYRSGKYDLAIAHLPEKNFQDHIKYQKTGFKTLCKGNFDNTGQLNAQDCTFEYGFVRHLELKWSQVVSNYPITGAVEREKYITGIF